jgi:hypothetical protein
MTIGIHPANEPAFKNPFGKDVRSCGHHMRMMQAAIQGHGLWDRVSKTHEELVKRVNRFDPYDIDPLLVLYSMIEGKARHMAALNDVEITARCPVCYFDVGEWIEEAALAVATRIAQLDAQKLEDQARNAELEAAVRSV